VKDLRNSKIKPSNIQLSLNDIKIKLQKKHTSPDKHGYKQKKPPPLNLKKKEFS
jgi:hypothetical protein